MFSAVLDTDMCMRSKLDPKIIEALQAVVQKLKSTDIKWALAGSLSLALQGVKVDPGDIDILTDREGAYRIAGLLKKHEKQPVRLRSDKWSRSHFGEFEIKGVKIEVMGDLEEKTGDKWTSLSGRLVSPKSIKIDRMKVPVSSLEEQLKSYRLSGRRQDKIRLPKIQKAVRAEKKRFRKDDGRKLAAPCGLYCGSCINYLIYKNCHGCGCSCGACAASDHHKRCELYKCCGIQKVHETCAQCKEFPCSMLIQFCYSPVWLHHASVIENLRRQKAVGIEEWLKEQKEIWKNEWYLQRWLWLQKECEGRLERSLEESKSIFTNQ